MLVLIPNPNQTAELVKMQKAFIADHQGFYQHTPLWIFLDDGKSDFERDFTKAELKELAGGIQKVELYQPQLYFSKESEREVFASQAVLETEKEEIKGRLILCKSIKSADSSPAPQNSDSKALEATEKALMQLKIFRLANAEKLAPDTYAVNESVWRKIKTI